MLVSVHFCLQFFWNFCPFLSNFTRHFVSKTDHGRNWTSMHVCLHFFQFCPQFFGFCLNIFSFFLERLFQGEHMGRVEEACTFVFIFSILSSNFRNFWFFIYFYLRNKGRVPIIKWKFKMSILNQGHHELSGKSDENKSFWPNQSAPSIYIMIELCYFSLDQWEIKIHLLWGKCFNIPHWPRSHSTNGRLQHIEDLSKSSSLWPSFRPNQI